MNLPNNFINIDEEGYPVLSGLRVTDEEVGAEILTNLSFTENGAFQTRLADDEVLVEAFDEPLVAGQVLTRDGGWLILLPYSVEMSFDPHSLTLDDWDRFHGVTEKGIPFVFSRKAQAEFFRLIDDYDDESITIKGEQMTVPHWMASEIPVEQEQFWSNIYQTEVPHWELEAPAAALVSFLPQLKLNKSRILVLGCGSGNDAALFAKGGHIVTGVDISPEAISRARAKYGHLAGLSFLQMDLFDLGEDYTGQFDLIFEHTCYCAITPQKRNSLVSLWRRLLAPGGQVLGVFFAMERRGRPPFGGTEWELRERMKKHFRFLYWNRWRKSLPGRQGKELVVLAQKLPSS